MSETKRKLTRDDLSFTMTDFNVHSACRVTRKGGTAAIISKATNYSYREDLSFDDNVCIELLLPKTKNIIITGIYRNPEQHMDDFLRKLRNIYDRAIFEHKECIFVGDWNAHL